MFQDYINKDDKYLIIFTHITNQNHPEFTNRLNLEEGYSGNWRIGNRRVFNKVMLYVRENNINKIYLADYIDKELLPNSNRYRIYFNNVKLLDTIQENWVQFSGGQNPIRYINS